MGKQSKILSMWREHCPDGVDLLLRELVFRTVCRHRQGPKPNILLFAIRRSGTTMMLNTVASHPGLRYVGRPFRTALMSRFRRQIPDLATAAGHPGGRSGFSFIHFDGEAERQFRQFAKKVISAQIHIYPSLDFFQPYFQRVTDRVILQMTNETALIEWFNDQFDAPIFLLLRHPIPTGISVIKDGWRPNCEDFLNHEWFVQTHLAGPQVDLARRILDAGSPLAIEVLDWTLKMLLPIRAVRSGRHANWLVLTYEQAVLEPENVVRALSKSLDLPQEEPMLQQIRRASATASPSSARKVGDPDFQIKRWRKNVPPQQERELMSIPAVFGIDVYHAGQLTAAKGFTSIG